MIFRNTLVLSFWAWYNVFGRNGSQMSIKKFAVLIIAYPGFYIDLDPANNDKGNENLHFLKRLM